MPAAFDNATTQPVASTQPTTRPTTRPVDLARWWMDFRDPVLNSLIRRAISANLDLKIATARLRQARAQYGVTSAGNYPEVDIDGSATRQRNSINGPELSSVPSSAKSHVNPRYNLFQASFDASWELDIFGGQRRAVESAGADVQAAVENRRDALVSLLAETARNYIDYRALQRRLALTQQNIVSEEQSVKVTRARFSAGLTSDLDVARAEAQVKTTAAQLPAFREQLEASLQTLAVTLGTRGSDLRAELSPIEPIPMGTANLPVGLPSDLLRRRPDIRAAERQLASATAQIGVATADLFPKFSLTGSLGLQSEKLANFTDYGSRFWSIGPSVSWPIFSAGRIQANIHVQNAIQEQMLDSYKKTVLQALSDVETSLNAYTNERERRDQLADAVTAQQRALDLANQLYTQGVGEFLDVLDAQRSLFAAQDSLAQSDQAVASDLVSLYKALGGGWNTNSQRSARSR